MLGGILTFKVGRLVKVVEDYDHAHLAAGEQRLKSEDKIQGAFTKNHISLAKVAWLCVAAAIFLLLDTGLVFFGLLGTP
jgi:hypothetical protein